MRPRRFLSAAVAALAATLVLSACSSSSSKSSSPATGAGASTTVSPTTKPVNTSFTGIGSAAYCKLAKSYADATAKLGPGATPDLRSLFDQAATDLKSAVAVAPSEIKADVETVATGFGNLVAALDADNYNFTALPQSLIAEFMSTDFVTASTRVTAYARSVCGFSI